MEAMALIEIDASPSYKMVDLSMAMLVIIFMREPVEWLGDLSLKIQAFSAGPLL